MKRIHIIAFIVFLLLSCYSAYSLAQMNQAHKIKFSWIDNYKRFSNIARYSYGKILNTNNSKYMNFDIVTSQNEIITINGDSKIKYINLPNIDFKNNFLIFGTLGQCFKEGSFIHIIEITQRANIVEVMIDVKDQNSEESPYNENYPYDVIMVSKNNLTSKGNLLFIFKNSNGLELFRKECIIDKID